MLRRYSRKASSALVADTIVVTDESADTTCFPLFAKSASGSLTVHTGTNLAFNSFTGELTATKFKGAFNGTLGATTPAAIAGTTGTFSDDIKLAALKKLYLDGGSNTYISEVASDHIRIVVGTGTIFNIQSATAGVTQPFTCSQTLTSTGNFDCNSKINLTAASGDLQMDGDLTVSGTGPHAIGGAVGNNIGLFIQGAFTAGAATSTNDGVRIGLAITGDAGASTYVNQVSVRGGSIALAGNTGVVAALRLDEPDITLGAFAAAKAATLYITGAPNEGTGAENYAGLIDSGIFRNADTTDTTSATTGAMQTAGGISCALSLFVGADATINGITAGKGLTADVTNTFFGLDSGEAVTDATNAVGVGWSTLKALTSGDNSTALGHNALVALTTGSGNTAFGSGALATVIAGSNNVAVGPSALATTTSSNNTGVGNYALNVLTTGTRNVALGNGAGLYSTDQDDEFFINNQSRTDRAGDLAGSLLYGTFHATPASQTLVANAAFSATQTMAWGSGATISSSNKVRPDYAAMSFHASETVTVDYANVMNLVDTYSANGPATVSTADHGNNQLVFGDTRVYDVKHTMEGLINAAAQLIACTVFSIDQTTATVTDITAADPGVVTTAAAHGLIAGNKVKFTGIVGTMSALNDRIFRVGTVADTTHFEIQDHSPADFDTTGLVYTSGGATAEATSTGSHTHQTYPNNTRTATSGMYPFSATAGDAVELYIANDSGTTNFGMEGSRIFIEGL